MPPPRIAGYCSCDPAVDVEREAYLSAFQFGEDFRQLPIDWLDRPGFFGPCWSPWLWFDIDAEEDLERAATNTRMLCTVLDGRYEVGEAELLIFFSGSKGFHVGLPTALWSPEPSVMFHKTARRFAENSPKPPGSHRHGRL